MTYAQLIAAIQSYVENTFPATYLADGSTVSSTTQLNTFITQAEQRIFNTVQFPSLRRNVTGFTTTSNKYLACPADFLAAYSMAVIDASGNYEYLLNKDVNFIRQAYPQPTDTATPKYYALFGPSYTNSDELSFILGPTPDAVYSVELHYFFDPDSITIAPDGRTWLGDNFDSVLLYGSLVEASTFMKAEPDMVALHNQKYQEALALAKRLGDGLERGDAYRDGQTKLKVTT
jgi:hypothetical protein